MKIAAFLFAFFIPFTSLAQLPGKANFSVRIKTDSNNPITNATVELLREKDSSLAKAAISNTDGIADFENILYGKYLLRASAVNNVMVYSTVFEIRNGKVDDPALAIILNAKSTNLKEVVVEGKKTFYSKIVRPHCR